MAICLDYQSIYSDRRRLKISLRVQVLAAAVLLLVLATKVWVRVQLTDRGYQLAEVRQHAVQLDMERRELELQRSILLRPDKLGELARLKLGLRPLVPAQAKKIR